MTDVLRIAHPQNCPPYGNSRVGICEGNRLSNLTKIKNNIGNVYLSCSVHIHYVYSSPCVHIVYVYSSTSMI